MNEKEIRHEGNFGNLVPCECVSRAKGRSQGKDCACTLPL